MQIHTHLTSDTSPEAEAIQVNLLKKAGLRKRFELMRSLTRTMIQLSRRALVRRNPDLTSAEVDYFFLSLNYGHDIACRVKRYLEALNNG